MSLITLPIDIDFTYWASQLITDLPDISIPIPPDNDKNWRGWASQVVYNSNLVNVPIPNDKNYTNIGTDWKDWASYFIDSILIA